MPITRHSTGRPKSLDIRTFSLTARTIAGLVSRAAWCPCTTLPDLDSSYCCARLSRFDFRLPPVFDPRFSCPGEDVVATVEQSQLSFHGCFGVKMRISAFGKNLALAAGPVSGTSTIRERLQVGGKPKVFFLRPVKRDPLNRARDMDARVSKLQI